MSFVWRFLDVRCGSAERLQLLAKRITDLLPSDPAHAMHVDVPSSPRLPESRINRGKGKKGEKGQDA